MPAHETVPLTLSSQQSTAVMPPRSCSTCYLRSRCLPAGLDADEIRELDQLVLDRRQVRRGEVLFDEGDRIAALYVVRAGQFRLSRIMRTQEQRVMAFQLPSELIGSDAIAGGRHTCRSVALEDAEVCVLPFAQLTRLMGEQPTMQRHFMRAISHAITQESGAPARLDGNRVDQRFAAFLLDLSARWARLGYDAPIVRLGMSRGDISSYLGIRVESVSRLLARFKRKGWVSVNQREVALRDPASLEALRIADGKGGPM